MTHELLDEAQWKRMVSQHEGYFLLATRDTENVPVRLFLSERLLTEAEPTLYRQIINATRFPGVRMVAITPDVHYGYGVPVGCVILTDRDAGAVAMGPVGFDIGCGMVSAKSAVPAELATHDRKLAFHREVLRRVDLGQGGRSLSFETPDRRAFEDIVRGGAEHIGLSHAEGDDERARTERSRFEVDDDWSIPEGGPGKPERGMEQLGSLGGGNHFIELQRSEGPGAETGTLYVQVHTGSRGFGHGLATNYFAQAKDERPELGANIDLGYFTPDSPLHRQYLNAVAAGANFAIVNRLLIFRAIREAFRKVFKEELELVYEISHNLVQAETHPEFGDVWVHRKGATRALPAGHAALAGTVWEATGHPVLIPGSNRDHSFILRPQAGAVKSGFSVNHGAGRRLSRGQAMRELDQQKVDEQYARDHILVNLDGRVPLDEAGACYKSSREVIDVVEAAGLATIETTLFPLGSLKASDAGERAKKADRRGKERERDLDRKAARRDKR